MTSSHCHPLCHLALTAAAVVAVALPATRAAQAAETETVAPVFSMASMNVFRRFSDDTDLEKLFGFYADVLGFERLQTFDVGGGRGVSRIRMGRSELKFTGIEPSRAYVPGGVRDATGLRLWTFFFADEAALTQRFVEHGYPAPEFKAAGSGEQRALVKDPDGQAVELVVVPDAAPEVYQTLEVGLTVSDIEASAAFYRDFVGLTAEGSVHDPIFDTTKHMFRNGTTVISLRSFGSELPADTGSGGIQYVVSDVELVDRLARAREIVIDQPLSGLQGFALRTIWLDDPDGITNYFAQTGVRP